MPTLSSLMAASPHDASPTHGPRAARRHSGAALSLVLLLAVSCGGPDKEAAARHLKSAEAQLDMRQYIAALEFLDKALAAEPSNHHARFKKAEVLYNTARVDEAAKIMAKLYKEDPDNEDVRTGLAYMRKDQAFYDQAIELFESITLGPALYHPIAECLTGVGRHGDAANMLGELLALNPWDPKAYLLFSRVETKRDRADAAKLWGDFYRSNEKVREAERNALRAEHQGNPALALLTRGRSYYRSGRLFPGIAQLENATKQQPQLAPAHLTIGRVLTDLGRSADAIQAIEKALSLKPNMPKWAVRLEQAKAQALQLQDKQRSILDMAALYDAQSKRDMSRAVVLFEADRDHKNVAAMRLVVKYFDRPEDAFVRVWAWRNAVLADPGQAGFAAALKAETTALGIELKLPETR